MILTICFSCAKLHLLACSAREPWKTSSCSHWTWLFFKIINFVKRCSSQILLVFLGSVSSDFTTLREILTEKPQKFKSSASDTKEEPQNSGEVGLMQATRQNMGKKLLPFHDRSTNRPSKKSFDSKKFSDTKFWSGIVFFFLFFPRYFQIIMVRQSDTWQQ